MSKLQITLYVTPLTVTERMPDGMLLEVKHELEHPDAVITIYRTRGASIAGRYDKVRHAVMVTLQASGLSVSALRDYSGGKQKPRISQRESDARARTINMFGENE